MAKRYGAVIVFKKDLDPAEIGRFLNTISDEYIDMDYFVARQPSGLIESFDDRDGGPVWYIP